MKPILACVPSQNGLFDEPPQRHSQACCVRSTVRPVPLQISRLPVTSSGPFLAGVTASVPFLRASGSEAWVAGSPLALNPAATWLASHQGLFLEAPQRHSVARNPAGLPPIDSSARSASGPFSRTCAVLTAGAVSCAPPSVRS